MYVHTHIYTYIVMSVYPFSCIDICICIEPKTKTVDCTSVLKFTDSDTKTVWPNPN